MPTCKISRETILSAIRNNLPQRQLEHPRIPSFQRPAGPLKPVFEPRLQEAGSS